MYEMEREGRNPLHCQPAVGGQRMKTFHSAVGEPTDVRRVSMKQVLFFRTAIMETELHNGHNVGLSAWGWPKVVPISVLNTWTSCI
jgi:hypothetical protein